MDFSLIIALVLALLVGISLGLLGGGGAILTVPILTYIVGFNPHEAIASSLFIVGTTSVVGALKHARSGRVRWRIGALFGGTGMVGALVGGIVGGHVPGAILMALFAVMMIATALAMIRRKRPRDDDDSRRHLSPGRVMMSGTLVGFATGLVGAGGGFLIVPVLNLFGGLPMTVAVGTSLLVIVLNAFSGFAGHAFSVSLDWPIVLGFAAIAVIGSLMGARLTGMVSEPALRRGFGFFVLAMGALVVLQEVPALFLP